jgi:hypothetical protein
MQSTTCVTCGNALVPAEGVISSTGLLQCRRCDARSVAAELQGIIDKPRLSSAVGKLLIALAALSLHLYVSPSYFGFAIGPSLFSPSVFDAFTLLSAFAVVAGAFEIRRARHSVITLLIALATIGLGLAGMFFKLMPLV